MINKFRLDSSGTGVTMNMAMKLRVSQKRNFYIAEKLEASKEIIFSDFKMVLLTTLSVVPRFRASVESPNQVTANWKWCRRKPS